MRFTKKEIQAYSLSRAILASAAGRVDGYEKEISAVEAATFGLREPMGAASFYVPSEMLSRDLSVATEPELVATDFSRDFVGATLRAQAVVGRLGIQIRPNARGNVSLPVTATAPTPTWLADENSAITPTAPAVTSRSASPKTVSLLTVCSHQLLKQEPQFAESYVRRELATAIAAAFDVAVLQGSGSNGEPHGIVGTTNVGSITGTSIALAGILEFQSNALEANAVGDPQSFGYCTTPAVAEVLAARARISGTDALWQGSILDGTMCGARAISTSATPASTLIGGDWSQAIAFLWPSLLIGSDPFTGFRDGTVRVRAMLSLDVIYVRPQAFSVAASVT